MIYFALRNRRLIRKLAQAMRLMAPHDRKIFLEHFVEEATFIELAHLAIANRAILVLAAEPERGKPDSQKWIVGRARFQASDAGQLFIINGVTHGLHDQPVIMFKSTNS